MDTNMTKSGTPLVAWIVSHCSTPGKRELYVEVSTFVTFLTSYISNNILVTNQA
jgi:hypothetical protein